jgi:CheY-like chemotaxis protein
MPRGGRLTIRTANVGLEAAAAERLGAAPGHHVMLEVRDTGVGMDEATRLRVFEPFFTTKAPGKGTGLGLSTVYGIIQQSGGYIEVDSAPGRGATFRIFLPRVVEPVDLAATTAQPARARAGTETVLLLEDEAEVRATVRAMLVGQGYRVLEAENGVEALEIAGREDGPIDLLVTDVVMPHQSGPELARRLVALRPQTRVLYISGYPDDALGEHGVLHPGVAFLAKPFTAAELARKVREVLDDAGMLAP